MKHTLYLTYDGLTDPLGQSQVLPYVVGLSNKAWKVSIISFEKKERFEKQSNEIQSICHRNKINWIPQFYTKKPPVLSTLLDLKKMRSVVENECKKNKVSIIHCRSYLPMLIALPLQSNGIKIIFDMRGFWADERVEGNIWNLKNPLYRSIYSYFKRKEKQFLQQADAIVSLTQAAIPYLKEWGSKSQIYQIPTMVDLKLFNPSSINIQKKSMLVDKLNLKDKYILGYSGSLGTWYLLDEMLLFFKQLKEVQKNAHLLIVSQDNPDFLYQKAIHLGIQKNDLSIIAGKRDEMPLFLSIFDLSIMFIKSSFSKLASSPTKLGELMAMEVPVICNSGVGDVNEIVDKYKSGIVLEHFDENSINYSIKKIVQNEYFDVDLMKKGALEYYDLNKGVESYNNIYTSLTQ